MFLHNLAPKLPISENIIKLEDFIPYMDSVLTDTDNAISVLKYINEVLKLPHQSLIDMVINHLLAIFLHYEVPFDANDDFYIREFDVPNCNKHVGIAIDTDNYLTNETREINDKSLIKEVYMLSLSVEKELYSNLKDF